MHFGCSFESIEIPLTLQFIDGSAFIGRKSISVATEADHKQSRIENAFLLDSIDTQLIRDIYHR
jgi:hypothetical protein